MSPGLSWAACGGGAGGSWSTGTVGRRPDVLGPDGPAVETSLHTLDSRAKEALSNSPGASPARRLGEYWSLEPRPKGEGSWEVVEGSKQQGLQGGWEPKAGHAEAVLPTRKSCV